MTTTATTSARSRRVLLVPPLAAAAAGLLAARLAFDSDTHQDCRCPGPSPRMYVTSWAGVMCAVGCLLVFAAVRRGGAGAAVWPRRLAAGSACVALAVLLALLATVYWCTPWTRRAVRAARAWTSSSAPSPCDRRNRV
ncbi:hypothetical protein [Streptomyces sp. NPDC059786]|uniref:hypothetical protein n=1 Tax=Streptomyces sp. NPDC059786 TaxID=3346946 RepID=UPI003669AC5A